MDIDKQNFNRILIINVNWVGDVLFSTPFIRTLRSYFPESYIAVAVVPRCEEVLKLNPDIDKIIKFDERSVHKGIAGKLKLVSLLKKENFDVCFLLHRSFTRALIALLSGIPNRIGYFTRKRALLLTKNIMPKGDIHKVEYFLDILRAIGLKPQDNDYRFFISDEDRTYVNTLLTSEGVDINNDRIFVLNPGGNWDLKRWPKENFAQLIDSINTWFKDVKTIITGAVKDLKLAEDIKRLTKSRPINFAGKTTLKQLAALFEKSKLVISNDSGPMHVAVALSIPTIALFGPTSPRLTGPYGKGRFLVLSKDIGCKIPCYKLKCRDNKCMKAIGVDDVLKAIKELAL